MTHLLSTKLLKADGSTLNAHAYGYDLASQRTALTNVAGDYRNYTYDNAGQLKTAPGFEANATPRLNEQHGYAYDPAGNLNQRTNNAPVQTFNNNSLNELTTVTRTGTLTVAGNTTTNVTVKGLTAGRYTDLTYAAPTSRWWMPRPTSPPLRNHPLACGTPTPRQWIALVGIFAEALSK